MYCLALTKCRLNDKQEIRLITFLKCDEFVKCMNNLDYAQAGLDKCICHPGLDFIII